nr:unnamed protein product [Callosobruchus analis]
MQDFRRQTISEEHLSLLKEPGSEYLGHLSLASEKAAIGSKYNIIEFLKSKHIDCDELIALGCDGTAVNTCSKRGVIRCLKMKQGKALQWCISQLHSNELPLRKALKSCEQLRLAPFQSIRCTLTNVTNNKDLSTDQLYLFDMCEAMNVGSCADNLLKKNPGKTVHSKHLHQTIKLSRYLLNQLKQVIDPVIQRKGFFRKT